MDRMTEIANRKVEIRTALESDGAVNLDEIKAELDALEIEERTIQEKKEIAGKINVGELRGKQIVKEEISDVVTTDKFDTMEYRKSFMEYVTKGTPIPTEYRLDAVTATSEVGTVIPTTVINRIVETMTATGMILPLITRTAYKGGVSIPTSALKPVATWATQGSGSDTQEKTTSNITFAYWKLRCAVSVTFEVDVVSLPIFEATIIQNITEAMVKALEQSIFNGAGSASPKGILAETAPSGQALTGAATYAKLLEAEAALPIEYEDGAMWFMTKKTFMAFFGDLDDMGQPIARTNYGISGKPERTLLGRPVVLNNYIESYASNLTSAHFWAFLFNPKDYTLNTNYNITLKKYEDYTTDDQVTKALMLVDGKVVDKGSLVTLAMA